MRFAALAITGVVILATEKLDVVVVLVEVEIEVAAAITFPSTPPAAVTNRMGPTVLSVSLVSS